MTVQATVRKAGPTPGNSVATVFPFAFKVFVASDLVVILTTIATGVRSTLVLNDPLGYTVALNGDQNANPGGSVIYNPLGVPMPATQSLTILSAVPQVQGTHIINGGAFFANNVEDAIDKVLINLQDLALGTGASIQMNTTDPAGLNAMVPSVGLRANLALMFDAVGNVIAGSPTTTAVSAAWLPVVQAASLAAGRLAMGHSAYFDSLIAAATKAAFDALISPLTTKGDLWVRDATQDNRKAVGPDGLGLVADSTDGTGVSWKTIFNDSTQTDVATAATCNIFAALTSVIRLTGTTDITSFDAAAPLGKTRLCYVQSTGARLVNSANLINPLPFDIQLMAGDWFIAVSMGTNVSRIAKYQRANGQVLLGGYVPVGVINRGIVNAGASTTIFAGPHGLTSLATELDAELIIPEACTVSELRLVASAALAGGTAVATIRKNRADTAVTCTLAAASGTTASDVTHTVDYEEGDRLTIKLVTGAIGATTDFGFTALIKKKGINVGVPLQFQHNPKSRGNTNNFCTHWGVGGTEADEEWLPGPCRVQSIGPYLAVGGTVGPYSGWDIHKNGGLASGANYPTGAYAPNTAAGSGFVPNPGIRGLVVAFAEGDTTALKGVETAIFGTSDWTYVQGTHWVFGASEVQYPPSQLIFHCNQQVQAATRFAGGHIGDVEAAGQSATETDVQLPMPACTLRNLRACAGSAPAAGQTITVTLRKNGVDTGLTVTITSAGRTATDLVDSVAFAAGDLATLKVITSATSGTRSVTASIEVTP